MQQQDHYPATYQAVNPPPSKIIIPDLVSHCDFPLRNNRHRKQATVECKQWLFRGGNLDEKSRNAFHGLKAGLLTSMCYPKAAYPQLRVCCDFMNWLFHLDNISDDMNDHGAAHTGVDIMNTLWCPDTYFPMTRVGKMTRDFWRRLTPTATPGTQQRFRETMDFFFQSVIQQAMDREAGVVPDLESYISLRRDTSGCKPCWALIEFAYNLKIPDEVMDHPVIRNLGEAANDLVTWSNDIFSFNVEQSKGDTHNMIVVVMNQEGLDLQSAVDFVGELCRQSIDRFVTDRASLPSWDPEIDRQVAIYVDGLADWIVGSLHWSFESERYFGKTGMDVKRTRVVQLLPRRVQKPKPTPITEPVVPVDDVDACAMLVEGMHLEPDSDFGMKVERLKMVGSSPRPVMHNLELLMYDDTQWRTIAQGPSPVHSQNPSAQPHLLTHAYTYRYSCDNSQEANTSSELNSASLTPSSDYSTPTNTTLKHANLSPQFPDSGSDFDVRQPISLIHADNSNTLTAGIAKLDISNFNAYV